ncbi:MAG: tetraacyldisaccharide 4'-kinase [Rhodospirillales bacterium]|nr:tetraacyldisaccharide 4'-kinase [Rhodospirillales bacterium]
MRLSTPSFWYKKPSLTACFLAPLSWLYQGAQALHQRKRSVHPAYDPGIPVICVGNLVAGGSGKTPTALALYKLVTAKAISERPCFLNRGYGGTEKGPLLVDPAMHTPQEVGDEALLLAAAGPTIVATERQHGALLAREQGFDLIIMDDGLQNPSLRKTLSLVVIDGSAGFGNGRPLPAGPLREPLETGLARADAFLIIGDDKTDVHALLPLDKPAFSGHIQVPEGFETDRSIPYVAFAGLGRPEKFKATLEDYGLDIAAFQSFPDHHAYTAHDLQTLIDKATARKARLITTQKDAVKLPAAFIREQKPIVMPIEIVWNAPDDLENTLTDKIKKTK